jgi:uncharacterized protein
MKIVQSVLLALSFLSPALVSTSVQAQSYDCYAAETESMEAVCALLGNARQAFNAVNALDSNMDTNNAKRYAREIINGSDRLAKLLNSSASDDAILEQLEALKITVLQLDAAKRKLQRRYPSNTTLVNTLTSVRTVYFYLEGLLLPVEE